MHKIKYDIFINYRREDTQPMAVVLELKLREAFGEIEIFLDTESLQTGLWRDEVKDAVTNADLVICLVGPKWLEVRNPDNQKRRIDEKDDWVRREIEHAVESGRRILTLYVDGGDPRLKPKTVEDYPALQKWLENWNAKKITWEHLKTDFDRLAETIGTELGKKPLEKKAGRPPKHLLDELYPFAEEIDPFKPDEEDIAQQHDDPAGYKRLPAPYLGIRHFRRKDARLFFGRTPEILEFFNLVQNPGIRIISLYGNSGVGKSSFLAAGVLPRLEKAWRPFYERRNRVAGLGAQLRNLLEKTKEPGKPPVYILDQVEEIITDRLSGETADFVKTLEHALHADPSATFVLGYRSEYLQEMRDLLQAVPGNREDLPLRHLGEAQIAEAVRGVSENTELSRRYQLVLEPGFAEFVARNLLQNESGGISSMLQNRLLRLYENAFVQRAKNPDGLALLRIADYQELTVNKKAEEELLDYQLHRLRAEQPGLALDDAALTACLYRFVKPKPSSGSLAKDDPALAESATACDALLRVNLLSELREPAPALRLSHDLLAEVVSRRHESALMARNANLQQENLDLLLRQIRADLPELKFEDAARALEQSLALGIHPELRLPIAFELAWVYLQAGKPGPGRPLHEQYAQLCREAGKLIAPMPAAQKELPDWLKNCDPPLYRKMEETYFPVMRPIPGGVFEMGDVLGDKENDDETLHTVELSAFELAETPITWQQYGLYCLAVGKEYPHDEGWGRADRPVINVSWEAAVEYADWLNGIKGLIPPISRAKDKQYSIDLKAGGYRLPTEAEWEYAAREGGKPVRFGNGKNTANPAEMNFNGSEEYKKGYSKVGEYRGRTTPVRQKLFESNALGLFDMSGNVWEWCWDWYDKDYYKKSPPKNPEGSGTGKGRVLRGGSWYRYPGYCRVAYRFFRGPDDRYNNYGFRLARTL